MRTPDYYDILGVTRSATAEEIHAAYRKTAKAVHPDTGGTSGMFRLLKEANDTLTDPVRRRLYDGTMDGPPPPANPPPPPPQPKSPTYRTYVPPQGSPTYAPPRHRAQANPPTPEKPSQGKVPWVRQFDIFRPTRIDILTVALAAALLAVHLVMSALQGSDPPRDSILGRIPLIRPLLGAFPDAGSAVIYMFALYIAPAMVLSRMMITPLLARAHRHGRTAYIAAAVSLGLLTTAILWNPITWIVLLGVYAGYWALRAAWHVLCFFTRG